MRFTVMITLLLFPLTAISAPAPLMKRDRSGNSEVVFEARTTERARLARVYLHSREFASLLRKTAQSQIPTNQQHAIEWLKNRFHITIEGTRVRVRVNGSRTLRTDVTISLIGQNGKAQPLSDEKATLLRLVRDQYAAELASIKALRELRPERISQETVDVVEARVARIEFEVEPLKLGK